MEIHSSCSITSTWPLNSVPNAIDGTGEHWTFGQPAVIGDTIYVRSQ